MPANKIKAILFDKDGVLVDFQATYGNSTREVILHLSEGDSDTFQRLAGEIGFNITDNFIDPHSPLVGGCALDICAVWARVLGIENSREFQSKIDNMFKQLTESGVVLIEGVDLVLEQLGTRFPLGLATNDMEACARAQLTHTGIVHNFSFLSGYDSGHGPKPETGMAKAFLQHTGIAAVNTAMVGDSVHDMNFAKAAGLTAIGVSTGPLPMNILAQHADYALESLSELPQLLRQL